MRISFSSRALKDLKELDKDRQQQVIDKIAGFEKDPSSVELQKLKGYENQFRLRVGTYRIRLEILWADGYCEIKRIMHRREVYR